MELSKSIAFMNERNCVFPEDVIKAVPYIMRHRIYLTARARVEKQDKDSIIADILKQIRIK